MIENGRQFARVDIELEVILRSLDADEVDSRSDEIRAGATVWAPRGESGLREMVTQSSGSSEGLLAQAILDLSQQIVHLRSRLRERDRTEYRAQVLELSGGGGRLRTDLPLSVGEQLELRFEDEIEDAPPLKAVIGIVHASDDDDGARSFGFRFDTIHRRDQDRLIRFLYQIQRRALRNAHA